MTADRTGFARRTGLERAPATDQAPTERGLLLVAGSLAALHLAMYGYDLGHPDRFLNTDRTGDRLPAIQGFVAAWHGHGDLSTYLASNGIPGDWLPQALLYLAGGQYLVIAAQVVLALASVLWVREIGIRLGLTERRAEAAALLYGLLPHTLVLPHQLASEAISVPLVVAGFFLGVRAAGAAHQAGAGAALGFASLVRPVTMLWPLVHAAFAPAAIRARAVYLFAALAPLALWMAFAFAATGEISTGSSGHDLGHNLYGRVERMSARLPPGERMQPRPAGQRTLTLREYVLFSAAHPRAALAHSGRDLLVVGFKSGLEGRVFLDYLGFYPEQRKALQDPNTGWRAQVEQRGFAGALPAFFRAAPGLVAVTLCGAVLFAMLTMLAALGALNWARGAVAPDTRRLRLLLIGFVGYVAISAQAASEVESRHRAPAEFALCLLAVTGWAMLRRGGLRHGR